MNKFGAVIAMLIALSPSCFSDTITVDTSKLTGDEKAAVYKLASQNPEASKVIGNGTNKKDSIDKVAEAVNSISTVGAGAIIATAKGVGTAASDFAKTPAGTAVVAGAIYHFIGDSLITQFKQLFILPIFLLFFTVMMAKTFQNMITDKTEILQQREPTSILFGLIKFDRGPVTVRTYISSHHYDLQHFIVGVVYTAVTIACIVKII